MSGWFKAGRIIRNMGTKSILISMAAFLFTVVLTGEVGYQFYCTIKENIHLKGEVNAVESAKQFDSYLLVRKTDKELWRCLNRMNQGILTRY